MVSDLTDDSLVMLVNLDAIKRNTKSTNTRTLQGTFSSTQVVRTTGLGQESRSVRLIFWFSRTQMRSTIKSQLRSPETKWMSMLWNTMGKLKSTSDLFSNQNAKIFYRWDWGTEKANPWPIAQLVASRDGIWPRQCEVRSYRLNYSMIAMPLGLKSSVIIIKRVDWTHPLTFTSSKTLKGQSEF